MTSRLVPFLRIAALALATALSFAAGAAAAPAALAVRAHAGGLRMETATRALELGPELQFRVFLNKGGNWITLSPEHGLPAGFSARADGALRTFRMGAGLPVVQRAQPSRFGPVERIELDAATAAGDLQLRLTIDFPHRHADAILLQARFVNSTAKALRLTDTSLAALQLRAPGATPDGVFFWSFNGAGIYQCKDYILPVRAGFSQKNDNFPLGGELGGGTPFADLWRPEMGVALAAVTPVPILATVPVSANARGEATLSVMPAAAVTLAPGATHVSPVVMVTAHELDFYDPLVRMRELLGDLGVRADTTYQPDDYAPTWGTWAFKKLFDVPTILSQVRRMKMYGITELIMDDGWYDWFGDWQPLASKFPRGDADVRALVDKLHADKITLRLWWTPGVADLQSQLARSHPDWFIHDQDGKPAKASWTAYFLCPAHAPVRAEMARLIRRFVHDLDVDSFKLDGPCLNAAPLCHNAAHRHARPEESYEQWPGLFAFVKNEARKSKPGFRVEVCPCGLTPSLHLLAGMGQATTSDPWDHQVTSRMKFLKAVTHPRSPIIEEYCGGGPGTRVSIELAPRTIGTGGVYGTMHAAMGLTQQRWATVYNQHRLAEGDYLNLYNLGWEPVEGHAIRKGGRMYYGFYSNLPDEDYVGPVQLRGLERRRYRVTNYVKGRVLGEVTGPVAELPAFFRDSLLLVAEPLANSELP